MLKDASMVTLLEVLLARIITSHVSCPNSINICRILVIIIWQGPQYAQSHAHLRIYIYYYESKMLPNKCYLCE